MSKSMQIHVRDEADDEGQFTVDGSKNPKAIEVTNPNRKMALGIEPLSYSSDQEWTHSV